MSKKTTKHKRHDSSLSDRHGSSSDLGSLDGNLSNTERRLMQEKIKELERIVAAMTAANARDSEEAPRTKVKDKKRLQNPLTVLQRTFTSSPSGKSGVKASRTAELEEDLFTAEDLDLDAGLEEDDEYDSLYDSEEDYNAIYDEEDEEYTDQEAVGEEEESEMSDYSDFDRTWSDPNPPTLKQDDEYGMPEKAGKTQDPVLRLRDDLERNQVWHVLQNLSENPALLNHNFGYTTTLKLVIQRRSLYLLEQFLANPELDINETYYHGRNVAHWILEEVEPLEEHHVECLSAILKLRPDFAFCTNDAAGNPALWCAIMRAYSHAQAAALRVNDKEAAAKSISQMRLYLSCAKLLARGDANVLGGRLKMPVLSLSVDLAFEEAFDLLLSEGADPNAQDIAGNTPLHHLIELAMNGMNFARAVVAGAGRDRQSSLNLSQPISYQTTPLRTSGHHHHSSSGSGFQFIHQNSTASLSTASSSSLSNSKPSSSSTPSAPLNNKTSETSRESPNKQSPKKENVKRETDTSGTFSPSLSGSISQFLPSTSSSTSSGIVSPRGTTISPDASSSLPLGPLSVRRSLHLSRSNSEIEDLVGGGVAQSNDTVRHMCIELLEQRANIFLANHQHQTPYTRALLRPDIHIIFESYYPGSKVWKHRIDDLTLGEKIGTGYFGEVYLARMHGSEFAVKMIKAAEASTHEAGIMSDIRHPNVLTFVGIYIPPLALQMQLAASSDSQIRVLPTSLTESTGSNSVSEYRIGIVTEYLAMGSLASFLGFHQGLQPSPTTISWPVMMRIALTVARGMAWLHSRQPPVYHHDLHAGNVLLANDLGDTKLCDFGLSRVRGGRAPAQQYDRIRAPEKGLGPASDIYSFGFLLYQLLYAEKGTKERIQRLQSRFRTTMIDLVSNGVENLSNELNATNLASGSSLLMPSGLSNATSSMPPSTASVEVGSFTPEEWAKVDERVRNLRPWFKPPLGFKLVDPNPWPQDSSVCYLDIAYLIVECTDDDPAKRPAFIRIIEELERLSKPRTLASRALTPQYAIDSGSYHTEVRSSYQNVTLPAWTDNSQYITSGLP